MKPVLAACTLALCLGVLTVPAHACWDNTDEIIAKLEKLELSTDQLKAIFALRDEHKAEIARAHKEGLGCRHHENHEGVFEMASIGVLTSQQFQSYTGRVRTAVESLSYEVYLLKTEIASLEKEISSLGATPCTQAEKAGCSESKTEKKSGCCSKSRAKTECTETEVKD